MDRGNVLASERKQSEVLDVQCISIWSSAIRKLLVDLQLVRVVIREGFSIGRLRARHHRCTVCNDRHMGSEQIIPSEDHTGNLNRRPTNHSNGQLIAAADFSR